MSFTKAIVEWAVAQKNVVLEGVRSEAPVGGTRQLEMFSDKAAGTTLVASLRSRAQGTSKGTSIVVSSPLRYAVIVKEGRAEVVPVSAQVLHWVDEEGNDVFAMKSSAVDPNPYPQRGWEKVKVAVVEDLSKRMRREAITQMRNVIKKEGLF